MYRLISFDLMGTLIKPKTNVARQYIETISRYGPAGAYTEKDIWMRFYDSYRHQANISPVYGFYTQQDTYDWWRCVFHRTFEAGDKHSFKL